MSWDGRASTWPHSVSCRNCKPKCPNAVNGINTRRVKRKVDHSIDVWMDQSGKVREGGRERWNRRTEPTTTCVLPEYSSKRFPLFRLLWARNNIHPIDTWHDIHTGLNAFFKNAKMWITGAIEILCAVSKHCFDFTSIKLHTHQTTRYSFETQTHGERFRTINIDDSWKA